MKLTAFTALAYPYKVSFCHDVLRYNGLAHTKNLLRYISKRNELVQLVVQVKYPVNVIDSLGSGDRHTEVADKSNYKKPGMRWLKCAPGLEVRNITYQWVCFLLQKSIPTPSAT